ncbi:E3 ubiquitin-protein ligase MYCBP2-like Protein [Tribolium castaneum]|uniref:RCR-type E3 ubiquitin transferase n=1 Tax=Tribolium castaneum TaxID=7070 RepID=D6WED4_TRICA|nr:E3 ubiquitin-protein ligase MYCBP2-like Protein [Tribolium castaneum]
MTIHSNERLFLRDFVSCVAGSSGGRLAQWLQPASRVDPSKCQVLYSREELRCGWPAIITVVTRNQYSDLVNVPNMKVEVKAIPIDKKELGECDSGRKIPRVMQQPDPLSFGGFVPPPIHNSYEPTIRDKMCFHSISVMKSYQNYSFEELRYACPTVKRSSENMLVRHNSDGTYSATWTPASVGFYSIVVNIDGYDMEEAFKVEVKEPPQGMTPPSQITAKKSIYQPSKLRKFVAQNSAGLRIRAHPSLQSEQIGVVHVNGTIAFIDEIHNDDGVWLRLSAETIKQYCTTCVIEAWCLQYNQHLGKTLLLPVEEPKSILDQVISDTIMRKLPEISDRHKIPGSSTNYQVIKCGASGHNIRSRPSLKAPPVGMLVLGNRIGVIDYAVNPDGYWVLLDKTTAEKYCFNTDHEAWSLAIGPNNVLYLGNVTGTDPHVLSEPEFVKHQAKKGFDFSCSSAPKPPEPNFSFSGQPIQNLVVTPKETLSTNPFVFGDSVKGESPKLPKRERKDSKLSSLPKWFKGDDVNKIDDSSREHGCNGNGITPPGTPKRSQSPRAGHLSPKPMSRSSSPVPIPSRGGNILHDSTSSSPQAFGSPRSIGMSPLVRRGSNQSDTSALVSSLTRDLSQSPSQATQPRDLSPSPSGSSLHTSPPHTPNKKENTDSEQSSKKLTQTGTQTSPENSSNPSIKGHFSIGSGSKDERMPQKVSRVDRATGKARPKRAISPASLQQLPTSSKVNYHGSEPAKHAMSPSVAESLRAVFAAFLWHEGIVHDAMACASFLKFHPTLPKQGALVVTRQPEAPVDKRRQELSKEEKARQRHSVEVSNAGNYLHIQPSTLESLTRSAANASANRKRPNKYPVIINEESGEKYTEGGYGYHTISVLPPALKSLVFLWEELTTNCLQAISHDMIVASPVHKKKAGKDKEKNATIEKDSKKSRKKKISPRNYLEDIGLSSYLHSSSWETLCELCGEVFPHPVTYHMHQSHPGCGQHAGGKGYNSGGNYCLGWAGNCGDGGIPNSSWYLLCESCREKYVKTNRGGKQQTKTKNLTRRKSVYVKPLSSPSTSPGLEPHVIMKNNAMFLLDLASSADAVIARQRRPSSSVMPSVSENNSPPDCGGPFSPVPPFQCLQALGANLTPNEPEFYEKVLRQQNLHEVGLGQRPLSEVSISDNDSDSGKGLRFHRSVSMGTNGIPWSKTGLDGRIIMLRKRNNSSSEIANEGGSSLLCNPSNALQKLVPKIDTSAIVKTETCDHTEGLVLLQRPVMQFLLQQHDLESLQLAMKQALRKAMCRVYAMQALNWLLKSVTQPICLHDLLWWFVTSLTPAEVETETDDDNRPAKKIDDQDMNVCEHPLSDITIAGDAVHPLPSTFHALLQTIADLMVLLPMGSSLQQMAVRCWGLRFAPSDHSFLHRSQVFSNISKILSRSEEMEDCTISMHESHQSVLSQATCSVECLKDLTPSIEIKASSRQAMIGSLTDGSTETFWESGDEDRNKTKSLTVVCAQNHHPTLICVHIDNCRDLGNKVSSVTFYSGPNTDEMIKLRTVEVESRILGGWVNCPLTETIDSVIRLELKGPDNSVRVRQIRVLGKIEGESLKVGKQYNAATIQQRNCEAETLRVFRLITSQVFGKLLQGEEGQNLNDSGSISASESLEPLEESNDLREHMVGILFSRSKLTHLQKQVIVHIVQAIRKETERVREEWETSLCSNNGLTNSGYSQDVTKNSDTYCFEMLSMVLALSGSSVGRAYLSHQGGLLGDLLSLLHTGSARVQRQVTSLLRRILPEVTPDSFAKVMGITNLPPKDFSIVSATYRGSFDMHKPGILDVFLSVIAKALTVQVKIKSKNGAGGAPKEINTVTLATSIYPKDNLGKRWWLRGCVNRKLAEVIVHLIKDMACGKLSEMWANVTKGAIAENILALTQLSEEQRVPTTCLRTPTLWLALASLCVLDKDHVDRLSSGQWSNAEGQPAPPRPTCTNHDDGETNAVIQCNTCGNLCADCDRFLHLHRKTRNHQRQVCKEEEEAIKVELHEGCGRTKLFWLLALADARTLKALIEYRDGGARSRGAGMSGVCRFCGATGSSGLLAIGNVCADHECQEYGRTACPKLLNCGHMCGGILGENVCLPCLHGCSNEPNLRQDADDMCMICFTEALSCAPAIQLKCGHVFHLHCCKAVLMKRWAGPRITFSFSLCPICKEEIVHPTLDELLAPIRDLYKDVKRKALMRLEYEGLHTVEVIVTPGARFYNDPASYAMDRYAYYVCYKCNKAYYGGEARCDAEVGENYDPTELVCGGCSDVARAQMCPKHGTDFLEYKCRYCCSVAVFFCFGTTHFCNPCHDDFQRVTNLSKTELPSCPAGPKAKQLEGDECPLHVKHPPTGEEFALGCGVCRNAHTF